ncbi:1,4-dihydroxy-2-naphthoate octaprenyltransferase [Bizionia argentinensis JUB59]|uniref:1,4-dihydroxy-2-naphthoate octaprenyltransferase n=1 Tax=Bizionia argentinensis JUB59 TaxID=1046627 RepID=G2E9V8_9FLAO|nr:1,4-dihydroxy-2-naphthoate octaprenyltransferase [Bizionia argentinensis]EGV44822.1 1,4-dihydroxy-2-naphthoate octaprenyltransferase [Bizionia argentinensis JUB59]
MPSFKHWVSAARVRTLPLSLSGIIIATCFAAYNGFMNWPICILAILTTVALQVLSNFANDYGDGVKGTDNHERIGPQRALQSGAVSAAQMLVAIKINIAIIIILVIALLLTAFGMRYFLYTMGFLVLGGFSVYAAISYTVGDSAYGYRGLGDIFVFIFFGIVSTFGTYFLYALKIDHIIFLPACIIGLLSVAVLNLNNMRDIISDKNANKITLAVKLGLKNAKKYHYFLIGGAIVLSLVFTAFYYVSPFNLLFMVLYIPLVKHLFYVKKTTEPSNLDQELKKVALSTFFLAILMGVGYLI